MENCYDCQQFLCPDALGTFFVGGRTKSSFNEQPTNILALENIGVPFLLGEISFETFKFVFCHGVDHTSGQ